MMTDKTDISREAVDRLNARLLSSPSLMRRELATTLLSALRDALDAAQFHRHFLWNLLDNIDTLDDACKGNDASFRERAYAMQRRRFEISSSDGYKITFQGEPSPAPSEWNAAIEAACRILKMRDSIMADVSSAHSNRGNGPSEWMREDDRDFRKDLRSAFDALQTALKRPDKGDGV